MTFFDLIKKRKSTRRFSSKPVEEAKIRKILKATTAGPSAGNLKAFSITVVGDSEPKKALKKAALGQDFVSQASHILVFWADGAKSSKKYGDRGILYSIQDATIACTYAMLAATELGLVSCWVGAFDEDSVGYWLKETDKKPVTLLPLGYTVRK